MQSLQNIFHAKTTKCSCTLLARAIGYVGIGLFYGQLTCHGTAGGFLWLYLGVRLATCHVAMESVW